MLLGLALDFSVYLDAIPPYLSSMHLMTPMILMNIDSTTRIDYCLVSVPFKPQERHTALSAPSRHCYWVSNMPLMHDCSGFCTEVEGPSTYHETRWRAFGYQYLNDLQGVHVLLLTAVTVMSSRYKLACPGYLWPVK